MLHEGADLADDIGKAVNKSAGQFVNFQKKKVSGRSVTYSEFPVPGTAFEFEIGWWTEGKHLVVAAGVDAIAGIIAVADGQRPSLTKSALWKKYRVDKADFEVAAVGWFDMGALRNMVGKMPVPVPGAQQGLTVNKVLSTIGLQNVGAVVCRTGYRGRALWSQTTLEAPGKKTGLVGLVAQKSIGFSDLPPLPQKTNAFYACSLDWSKSFAGVTKLIKDTAKLGPQQAADQAEVIIDQIPALIGFDPATDLFGALGNVSCIYVDPGQAPFGIGAAAVIEVKDAKKLRNTFNEVLQRIGTTAPKKQFNVRRTKKHGREIVTLEIAGGVANPSYVIDEKWMAIGLYPQSVEAFLLRVDGKLPKWSPGPEYRTALADMPKRFTSISVSDPREMYRMILGLAPAVIPILKMALKEEGLNFELPISIADFPPTEVFTRYLFPNVSVCTVDDDGIHWTSRSSLPSIPVLGGGNVATSAVLAALLLPAVQQAREAARRTSSRNNLKQIGLAVHNYHERYGKLPQGTHPNANLKPDKRLSWMTTILPFIEQQNLFRKIDFKQSWDSDGNAKVAKVNIPVYLNPGYPSKGEGQAHYVGIGGVGKGAASLALPSRKAGIFSHNRITRFRDITDGTANTMMVSEASKNFGSWAAGGKFTIRELTSKPYINGADGIGGPYRGGCNVLFGDGSVRFISENINSKVFEALATMQGGEVVGGR